MTLKLEELIHKFPTPDSPQHSPFSSTAVPPLASPSSAYRLKLEVSCFYGSYPMGWIFKVTRFFEYHSTPEHERIIVASFCMDSKALAWFQWMTRNGQFTSWPTFLQALQTRFSPTQYEDPTGSLFKLTQRGDVQTYLAKFENLANRIVGLPPQFLLTCFISGLQANIYHEVQALQPLTLVQAAGLARLQEEKLFDGRRPPRPRSSSFSSPTPLAPPVAVAPSSVPLASPSIPSHPAVPI